MHQDPQRNPFTNTDSWTADILLVTATDHVKKSHRSYYNYTVQDTQIQPETKTASKPHVSAPYLSSVFLGKTPFPPTPTARFWGREGPRGPAQAGGRLVSCQNQAWGRSRVEAGSSFPREVLAPPNPRGPPTAPTWHLDMVPIHISCGVPEEAVGDEAVGVHAVDERKRSLGV